MHQFIQWLFTLITPRNRCAPLLAAQPRSERQALASGQTLPAPPCPVVDRPALKGPDNLAQGNALGRRTPIAPSPERASQTTERQTQQLPFDCARASVQ